MKYALWFSISVLMFSTDAAFAQPGGRTRGGFEGGSGERIEPKDLKFEMGVPEIPNLELFNKLSYKGTDVGRDPYLANLQYVKFIFENAQTDDLRIYFMNTGNYRAHPPYMRMVGIGNRGVVRGAISFQPRMKNQTGGAGLYVIDFQPNDSYTFEEIRYIRDNLVAKVPFLKNKLAFHPLRGNIARYEADKEKYKQSDVPVHLDSDLYANIAFLPLNASESFGRLRLMENETRHSPRDILICRTLPNQMPRVAGVISEERQTPLSHVNLRCVQDKVPNAYIANALKEPQISELVGKFVHYKVTPDGYSVREATREEVDRHFAAMRPAEAVTPERNLTAKTIRSLSEVKFQDAASVGGKSANLSAMQSFKLPEGMIPDGYAVPFFFYDEFMKHNELYQEVDRLLADDAFVNDSEVQKAELKTLRSRIEAAEMPEWMNTALSDVQKKFAEGDSIRCRSSTNNEDLPGFSGAGLYDSFTHRADEGHLSKSVRQVFASLWNFRAFEERQFYRIDHKHTVMGVLLHRNFDEERANGVAVTDDILYETKSNYYVNTLPGENLVTNPDESSSPEEILLGWWAEDGQQVVRRSTAAADGSTLLSDDHLSTMRKALGQIHGRFGRLYGKGEDDKFAMEVEFKITKEGRLIVKQARPWVF